MTACSEIVDVTVSVQIGRHDVSSTRLVVSEHMFFPWKFAILGLFPPSEPLAARKLITALRRTTNIRQTITVDVAEASIVRTAWSITFGKDMPYPFIGRARIFWHLQPNQ